MKKIKEFDMEFNPGFAKFEPKLPLRKKPLIDKRKRNWWAFWYVLVIIILFIIITIIAILI